MKLPVYIPYPNTGIKDVWAVDVGESEICAWEFMLGHKFDRSEYKGMWNNLYANIAEECGVRE